jgi:hypothetical protein
VEHTEIAVSLHLLALNKMWVGVRGIEQILVKFDIGQFN